MEVCMIHISVQIQAIDNCFYLCPSLNCQYRCLLSQSTLLFEQLRQQSKVVNLEVLRPNLAVQYLQKYSLYSKIHKPSGKINQAIKGVKVSRLYLLQPTFRNYYSKYPTYVIGIERLTEYFRKASNCMASDPLLLT